MKLPELMDLVALRGAAHGLTLHARRPVLAQLHGSHRSTHRGRGLEFEEVRLYASGDDARTIDWRVTARRGKPHTKLFREERERPVWLVVDLHAGLFFGSKRQFKSTLLVQTAALLGWVAVLGGDRVGAVITDPSAQVHIFAPRNREAAVLPILQALVDGQPQAPGMPSHNGLPQALATLRPLLQPGSLVLVLSDFGGLSEQAQDCLSGISLHNDCRLLWMTDPLERSGLPDGAYRVGLPQRQWWMDGQASRNAWQAAWNQREQRLRDLANRLQLPLVALSTADDFPERLVSMLREPRWAA